MKLKKINSIFIPVAVILLGLLASLPTLQFYGQVQGMIISYVSMLLLPLVFYIKEPNYLSMRFAALVLFCLALFVFIPSNLILLFGCYSFCFLIIESFLGKLNKLAMVLMVLASPIAYYLFEVFGFPIRLALTSWAAIMINFLGFPCQNTGNVLTVNGAFFSVDPVCMGLNMVMTSMLGCLILVTFFEKKYTQYFTNLGLLLSLIVAIIFVVIANLLRIVMIVLMNAPPETFLHESIGMLSMIVAVFLPLYLLLPTLSKYFSNPSSSFNRIKNVNKTFRNLTILFFLIGIVFANQKHPTISKESIDNKTQSVLLDGYQKEVVKFSNNLEVVSLTSEEFLIYIKVQHPYRITNHTPLICWQGSGFKIKNENILEVNQHKVFTAELVNEHERYFTIWWYDNGKSKTIGNFDWRWKIMKGEPPFRLINISSKNFSQLYMEAEWLIEKNLFE